jgi:outer membrane receptor protein involved in Fe transport
VQPVDFSLPGITTVNLRASWRPAGPKGIEWFVRATNILDRESASYGAIAQSVFDAAGNYTGTSHAAVFVAPAAPRAVSAGLRITF